MSDKISTNDRTPGVHTSSDPLVGVRYATDGAIAASESSANAIAQRSMKASSNVNPPGTATKKSRFRDWPVADYYVFTFGLGLAVGAALSLTFRRGYLPLAIVLSFMLATIAISVVVLDSRLQLSSVFGDSPIVAGRFSCAIVTSRGPNRVGPPDASHRRGT